MVTAVDKNAPLPVLCRPRCPLIVTTRNILIAHACKHHDTLYNRPDLNFWGAYILFKNLHEGLHAVSVITMLWFFDCSNSLGTPSQGVTFEKKDKRPQIKHVIENFFELLENSFDLQRQTFFLSSYYSKIFNIFQSFSVKIPY